MSRTAVKLLAGALALWHGWFFLSGYLTTADDVFFLDTLLQGPQHVWLTSIGMAQGHGRIGFYGLMPLNMWAAHMSVYLVWRILFVALYIGTAALIFVYAEKLLRCQIAIISFLLWLCLHPLGFDHLPPVAYPVQNTVPILVLVSLRLWSLERGERGGWMLLGRALQITAMLLTEFAALMGFVMMAAEAFVRHPLVDRGGAVWLRSVFGDSKTWRDGITAALVLGPYLGYRIAFPSSYLGNQIDGAAEFGALGITTLLHVLEGLVVFRLHEVSQLLPQPENGLILVGAVVAGVVMIVAVWQALKPVSKPASRSSALLFLLGAILVVTLPLTATTKQQQMCLENSCAYLDSRSSILGVVLILVLVLGTWRARAMRACVALAAGTVFCVGSLHNWQVAQQMQTYAKTWERAEALACRPDLVPQEPKHLTNLIDPEGLIKLVHTPEVKDSFWPLYLMRAQAWSGCADSPVLAAAQMGSYLPGLVRGAAPQTDLGKYLNTGWSAPELAGVWSNGQQALLNIIPQGMDEGERASLIIEAGVFLEGQMTGQEITVLQEGQVLFNANLTPQNGAACCRFEVPLLPYDLANEEITLTLNLPDARVPVTLPDRRQLGIFLRTLELR